MANAQNISELLRGTGAKPGHLPSVRDFIATNRARANVSDPFDLIDPEIDLTWGSYTGDKPPSSYYDYYYTGQDVSVYIDGSEDFGTCRVPVLDFAWTVQQQKQPVYGFWSYAWDAMMRGTRIVMGTFTIATTYPRRMADILTDAAKNRANSAAFGRDVKYHIRGLDTDEENINQYWGRNIDNAPAMDNYGRHIWSVHPPFNFVIIYGVQSISVSNDPVARRTDVMDRYQRDPALFQNQNERLVDSNPGTNSGKRVIENVELQQMQSIVDSDGSVLAERYSFMARDVIEPN